MAKTHPNNHLAFTPPHRQATTAELLNRFREQKASFEQTRKENHAKFEALKAMKERQSQSDGLSELNMPLPILKKS